MVVSTVDFVVAACVVVSALAVELAASRDVFGAE